MNIESQLTDVSYQRQVAFDALESNYENVILSVDSNFEESYRGFQETVALAIELLPAADHKTVVEIQEQLDAELLEHGVKLPPPAAGSIPMYGSLWYALGVLIIMFIIFVVYKWKSSQK